MLSLEMGGLWRVQVLVMSTMQTLSEGGITITDTTGTAGHTGRGADRTGSTDHLALLFLSSRGGSYENQVDVHR